MKKPLLALAVALTLPSVAQADVLLGTYDFNSALFGNSLIESDGGTFSSGNWLNTVNADPGNPGYLTGANFNTGIANIGGSPLYTIVYGSPITNGTGNDLGVVSARFSTADTITLEVSSDGGATFSGALAFGPGLANATGVGCSYFYGGGGPFSCNLFVTEIDLSAFGIASGGTINAVRITGSPEFDLIRVAGFATGVPEPASLALMGLGLAGLAAGFARRRRTA